MLSKLALGLLVVLVLIQFVPYGREHANPPVIAEPTWSSQAARDTFMRACRDCHSNETKWPWYSHVAPMSWYLQRHVEHGREEFNVSRWGVGENEGDEAAEKVRNHEMPLRSYLLAHPEARLSEEERAAFAQALAATFGEKTGGMDDEAEAD